MDFTNLASLSLPLNSWQWLLKPTFKLFFPLGLHAYHHIKEDRVEVAKVSCFALDIGGAIAGFPSGESTLTKARSEVFLRENYRFRAGLGINLVQIQK